MGCQQEYLKKKNNEFTNELLLVLYKLNAIKTDSISLFFI